MFYLKIVFIDEKPYFLFVVKYIQIDLSDATIIIMKVMMKKLIKLLRYGKVHSFQTIEDIKSKF